MNPVPLFKVHMPVTVNDALARTLASGFIAHGAQVTEFESGLGRLLGTSQLCAVTDASAGLTLALFLSGVRPGDEVVTSPLCCLATVMPIANLFAQPVWCDIDPYTGMPDASHIGRQVTERTRAVIVYYWSGNAADIESLRSSAPGVRFVADASEAFGAEIGGKPLALAMADFTIYSFSAVRHVTTGEGGALIAAAREDYELAMRARRYGMHQPTFRLPNGDLNPDSDIAVPGFNYAMNNIAATLGIAQFDYVKTVIQRYRENGDYFDRALAGISGITLLQRPRNSVSAYWTYSLRAERRMDLMKKLHENGVGAQRLHVRADRYSCFSGARRTGTLPGVDIFDRENLSIPCGWWVTAEDRERIAACIRSGW